MTTRLGTPAIRAADQILWSVGVFIFNLIALGVMSVELFAALAVSTAVGFVMVAVSRSYSTTAGIIVGAHAGLLSTETVDYGRAARTSGTVAALTFAGLFVVLSIAGQRDALPLAFVAAAMVIADAPRQCLVVGGNYVAASLPSVLYVALAFGSGLLVSIDGPTLASLWAGSLLIVGTIGWVVAALKARKGRPWHVGGGREAKIVALSLSAEAAYFGLAGQLGLLVLFAVSEDAATAALRVSYSLIFAPAFSVIQGLAPLLAKRLSATGVARDRIGTSRNLLLWWSFVSGTALLAGLGSFLWLPFVSPGTDPKDLVPFIAPVGISLVAGQIMEATVVALRITRHGRGVHLQRVGLAALDIVAQIVGALVYGVAGLVVAITAMAAIRIALSAVYLTVIRSDPSVGESES